MSSVDHRIVKMTFDNKQFRAGIQESLESLQRFEASLDTRELEKKFDLSPITKSLQSITNLFDPLAGAAERAFIRVTDAAVNAGTKMLKSLSVDNITAGFDKFGQKTQSVGTLIAQGYDIDTVTEQLEKLNWFTDETSYNFTDMVSNIGKFTASGKGLEESATAMEGIANWAALSGQNASVASRAMYQISQAMGAGVMRLEDYKSIQNASMDTDEFRQKALDAAVALGTLQKVGADTYETLKGDIFSKSQFTTQLTEGGWFTSDVMMQVFKDYSKATAQIKEFQDEMGLDNANEAMEMMEEMGIKVDEFGLKAFKAAQEARTLTDVFDSVKDAASTGFMNTFELLIGDYEEATELYTNMANTIYDVFVGPINSLNDMLTKVMTGDDGKRTEFLQTLANIGTSLIEIWNLVTESIRNVWEFNGFLPATAEQIKNVITRLKGFTENLILSDNYLREKLEKTLTGVFSILHIGWGIIKRIGKYVKGAAKRLAPVVDVILSFTAGVGDFFRILDNSISKIGFFNTFIGESERVVIYAKIALDNFRRMLIATFAENPQAKKFYEEHKLVFDGLKNMLLKIHEVLQSLSPKIQNAFGRLVSTFKGIKLDFSFDSISMPTLDSIWDYLNRVADEIRQAGNNIVTSLKEYTGIDLVALMPPIPTSLADLTPLIDWLRSLKNDVIDRIAVLKDYVVSLFSNGEGIDWKSVMTGFFSGVEAVTKYVAENFMPILRRLFTIYLTVIAALNLWENYQMKKAMTGFIKSLTTLSKNLSSLFGVADVMKQLANRVKSLNKAAEIKALTDAFLKFAGSIVIIAEAIYILTKINWSDNNAKIAVAIVVSASVVLLLMMRYISKMDFHGMAELAESSSKRLFRLAASVMAFGIGILLLVRALKSITKYFEEYQNADPQLIFASLSTLALMLVGLCAVAALMGHWAPSLMKGGSSMIALVLAIWLMIKPLKTLTEYINGLDLNGVTALDMALQRIGAIVLEMAAFCLIANAYGGGIRKGIGNAIIITALTSALTKLAKELGNLNTVQITALKQSALIIGVLVVIIGIITAGLGILNNNADLKAGATAFKTITKCVVTIGVLLGLFAKFVPLLRAAGAMIEIVITIGVMAGVLVALGKDAEGINKAVKPIQTMTLCFTAIGVVLSLMAYVFKGHGIQAVMGFVGLVGSLWLGVLAMQKLSAIDTTKLSSASWAIGILTASIVAIALSLSKLTEYSFGDIVSAAIGINATLAIIATALYLIAQSPVLSGDLIATAAALTIASVGILAIGKAFSLMENIDVANIKTSMKAIISLVVVTALAVGVLGFLAGSAPELAAGIVTVALALLVVAAAVYLFAQAIKILIGEDETLGDVASDLDTHGEDADTKMKHWSDILSIGIEAFGAAIGLAWDNFKEDVKDKAKLAFDGMEITIAEGVVSFQGSFPQWRWNIEQSIHQFKQSLSKKWTEKKEEFSQSVTDFFQPAIDKIEEIKEYFRLLKESIDEKGWMGTFALGLGDTSGFWNKDTREEGIKSIKTFFKDAKDVHDEGVRTIQLSVADAYLNAGKSEGKYLNGGLAEGIKKSTPIAQKAADKSALAVIDTSRDRYGVHSNSDEYIEIGKYLVGGLVEGIESKAQWAKNVSEWLATQNITSAADAIEKGKSYLINKIKGVVTEGQDTAESSGIDLAGVLDKNDISNLPFDWENVLGDVSYADYVEQQLKGMDTQLGVSSLTLDDYTSAIDTSNYSVDSFTGTHRDFITQLESEGPIIDKTTYAVNQLTDAYADMSYSTQQASENMGDYAKVLTKITDVSQAVYADKLYELVQDYTKAVDKGLFNSKEMSLEDYIDLKQQAMGIQGMKGLLHSIQDDWNAGIKMGLYTGQDWSFLDFMKDRTRGFGTSKGYYDNIHIVAIDPESYVTDDLYLAPSNVAEGVAEGMTKAAQNSAAYSAINYTNHLNQIIRSLADNGSKIAAISEKIEKIQVVLDSGTLVGELAPQVDDYLGNKMIITGRGGA